MRIKNHPEGWLKSTYPRGKHFFIDRRWGSVLILSLREQEQWAKYTKSYKSIQHLTNPSVLVNSPQLSKRSGFLRQQTSAIRHILFTRDFHPTFRRRDKQRYYGVTRFCEGQVLTTWARMPNRFADYWMECKTIAAGEGYPNSLLNDNCYLK